MIISYYSVKKRINDNALVAGKAIQSKNSCLALSAYVTVYLVGTFHPLCMLNSFYKNAV